MTKEEFINKVKAEGNFETKKDAANAFNAVFNTLSDVLASNDSFTAVGFGTFSVKQQPAREVRNPRTGEKFTTPAKKVARFKPGKALAEKVNA